MRVAVVGCGAVGSVTAGCLAWLGHRVRGLERDRLRIERLRRGIPPRSEPALADVLRSALDEGALSFTDDPDEALALAEVVLLAVGTPVVPDGTPDLRPMQAAVAEITPRLSPGAVVAIRSAVPIGSAAALQERFHAGSHTWSVSVASNPAFLRQGHGVEDFLFPARIVVGGGPRARSAMERLYRPVLEQAFPGGDALRAPDLLAVDATSAETIAYTSNAALAVRVSFANEVAHLCDAVGADAGAVLSAAGTDPRIGGAHLRHGLGFGGPGLPRDLDALLSMARELGVAAPMLAGAKEVNRRARERVLAALHGSLGSLAGRRIALLGLAFKPETDDTRASPAFALGRELAATGADVLAFDPGIATVSADAGIGVAASALEASAGADALVIGTPWPVFSPLLPALAAVMVGDVVADPWELFDDAEVHRAGLRRARAQAAAPAGRRGDGLAASLSS
jgi:UDPglucose 6-dehydrogenase